MVRTVGLVLLLAGSAGLLAGCAVLQEEDRHLAAWLDEHAGPESTPARVGLAPVAIPGGLAALILDGFLVNPVTEVGPASEDASFVFSEIESAGVLEVVVLPMRILTWTAVLTGSFLARCTLPIGAF